MKTNRLEAEVQAGVLAYLSLRRDCFCWRANTGGVKYGQQYVKYGLPGAADIQCLQGPNGRFIGIECKRELGGRVSADQEAWGRAVESAGGLYIVARSVEVVHRLLPTSDAAVVKPAVRKRVYAR